LDDVTLSPLLIASVGLTVVTVPLYLLAERRGWAAGRAITKSMASLGFIGTALAAGALGSLFGRLILAGLALSFLGDVLLLGRSRQVFLAGLVSFLLGHLAYAAAFIIRGIDWLPAAGGLVVVVVAGILIFHWLKPHISRDLLRPVVAYIIVISAMVTLALGAWGGGAPIRLLPGAVSFYLSDIAVARDRFIAKGFINRLVGLPLYYAGQLLIASCAGS